MTLQHQGHIRQRCRRNDCTTEHISRVTALSYLLASIMYDLTPPVYIAVRFYILMAVTLKITDFCDMTSCTLLETYQSSLPPIYPEYRGRTYLRDTVTLLPDHTALYKERSTHFSCYFLPAFNLIFFKPSFVFISDLINFVIILFSISPTETCFE
jgi:hypothetical protein